jgi:short-subunit dehydrogenase
MKRFLPDACTALITGASAGLGAEFARQLARRGGGLVLVARRAERLEQLRDELTRLDPNLNILVRPTDLANPGEVSALLAWLEEQHLAIDLLINNAGLGDYGAFASSDAQRVHQIIGVNMTALTQLTRGLLPGMVTRGKGGVLNVSSSACFLPIPGMALYAASKAYVTSLTEALRLELRENGVHVTALCPGPVETEFNQVARRPRRKGISAPSFTHASAAAVVRAGLRGLERDQAIVIPGLVMKLGMAITRAMPLPLLRWAASLGPVDPS